MLAARCSASSVDLLIFAICSMLLRMNGFKGFEQALARYDSDDPFFALLYYLLGDLRANLVVASTGLLATPAGLCAVWGGLMTPPGSLRAIQMPNAWFLSCPLHGYRLTNSLIA